MDNVTEATEWPIDFDTLERGTWIEPETIELAFSVKRDTGSYRLSCMKLVDMIEKRTGIVSRIDGERIRLMGDAELVRWNWQQHQFAIRKMGRCAVRSTLVRHEELNESDQRMAEYQQTFMVATAGSMRRALRRAQRGLTLGCDTERMKDWLLPDKRD